MIYVLVVLAILIALGIFSYNSFISLLHHSDQAWDDIEALLKHRHDLVPGLVDTARNYATHEMAAFENVTKAQAMALEAVGAGMVKRGQAENMLTGALKTVFALTGSYPALKNDQNFLALQNELMDTDNKLQTTRKFYNANVQDLNIKVQSFPANFFAAMFKFTPKEFFDIAGNNDTV